MKKQNLLQKKDLPKNYLNISYYLKKHLGELPDPPLDPKTKQPIGPEALAAIFPMEIIKQEVSLEEKIPIPDEVREIYAAYRPTPLIRAKRLERALDTSAHIYFKFEGASMVGNHKINSALAQAYYNKQEGVEELITETGAGQWGTALALATRMFGLRCTVFMVKCSYEQKPYRKTVMQLYGAKVFASPSRETVSGRKFLEKYPNTSGSLGMAISEAIEIAVGNPKNKYSLGSVLNHVMLHQTVIGQEAKKQMEYEGDYPDIVIGCCGGGANLGGIAFPFIADKLSGAKPKLRVVAVEPTTCASLTKGQYRYDSGDTAGMTPLLKMYTLGNDFVPSPIHAGGLRYHGDAPLICFLYHKKLIEAVAYNQIDVFRAAQLFAQTEGIISAPESAHAIKHVIMEALKAKEEGKNKTILFNLSGQGLLDIEAYASFNNKAGGENFPACT
ncbi:MAG: Tryptophan synthase beta chain [Microgenomates group bacterium GW2011_GWC1_39_12]|nr:MAG: Tryptophan synthase beta chain [Microgenomates group bacterium GW2011_GWC1_39_12]